MKKIFLILILSSLSIAFTNAQVKKYEAVKKESYLIYHLKHLFHEVEARSDSGQCMLDVDPVKKELQHVEVKVDVTSFDSGNSNRDSHAMEVIDAMSYPDAHFVSSSLYNSGDTLKVAGKMTFHGITRDITLNAFPTWSAGKLVVKGNFDLSLTEFQVERPSLLGIKVEDLLKFEFLESFNI